MKQLVRGTAIFAAIGVIASAALPAFASEAPTYVETVAPGVSLSVLATSGDIIDGYQIAGVPDGTGAYFANGKVQILNNHELSYGTISKELIRAGGDAFGSTIDQYSISPSTQKLTAAKEFLTSALFYDYATKTWGKTGSAPIGATATDSYGTPQHTSFLNRFCSASLSPAGRLFYKAGKKSYGIKDAIYLTGEEGGDAPAAEAPAPDAPAEDVELVARVASPDAHRLEPGAVIEHLDAAGAGAPEVGSAGV